MNLLERAKERLEEPKEGDVIRKKVQDVVLEAYLAKKLAEESMVRNACSKAFQAWKDLISALLHPKKEEVLRTLNDEQRKWFLEKGIYAPSSKLRALSGLLEDIGIENVSAWTAEALSLHTYQYHGPDPDGLWGGPANKEEALDSLKRLLKKLKEYVEEYFSDYLDEELKEALKAL